MERLFDGIPLDRVSTSMTINATAIILLSLYIAVARRRTCHVTLSGTIQNDILKEYIARGTYIYPPRPSLRLVTDIFAFCAREVPNWNTISISGYHIREAGSTAVQEVAFTLANGIAYVEAALAAGLDVDDSRRVSRSSSTRTTTCWKRSRSFARRAVCGRASCASVSKPAIRIAEVAFSHADGRLHAHRAAAGEQHCTLTIQALAAVLGGTQSLHTNSRDEALALPTEEAARVALRTQQIIASESGVAQTVDPVAGSFAIESLTNQD